MEGDLEQWEDEGALETVKQGNPEFAKLVDVMLSAYQKDGMPKSLKQQLQQVS